jgi:hypothetical protein
LGNLVDGASYRLRCKALLGNPSVVVTYAKPDSEFGQYLPVELELKACTLCLA